MKPPGASLKSEQMLWIPEGHLWGRYIAGFYNFVYNVQKTKQKKDETFRALGYDYFDYTIWHWC